MTTKRTKPAIKFAATPTTAIGTVVRHFGAASKFWVVAKIVDGIATAYPTSSPSGCC